MAKTKEINHDNLTHQQTLDVIRLWRQENNLIVNEESRRLHCGFCGQLFEKKLTAKYFGEVFHFVCVEKMKNGETNG